MVRGFRHRQCVTRATSKAPLFAGAFPICRMLKALCVAVAVSLLFGDTVSAWSQYRGNERRTGSVFWLSTLPHPPLRRSTLGFQPRPTLRGSVAWRVELGPMIDASPVVGANGTIYVAGPRWFTLDQLIAVTRAGGVAWRSLMVDEEEQRVYRLRSTPAIRKDGSLVVVGHYIEPATIESGRVKRWHRAGKVFLVDAEGNVQAKTETSNFFEGGGLTSPAYDGIADTLYWQPYPLAGASLIRLDESFSWTGAGGLSVTITGGTGFPGWFNAICYTLPWNCWLYVEFDPDPVYPSVNEPPPDDPLKPSPALTQCNDAVAGVYATLRTRKTGFRLWQKDIKSLSTPAIGAGGRAYIPTFDNDSGRIEGRDQDGERRFLFELPRNVLPVGPVALGRGVKDAGDGTNVVCRPGDGSHDHRHILDPRADNIYFIASDGKLYAVDYKGRLRWSIQGSFTSPPVVVELGFGRETVIVASNASAPFLHEFSGADGAELWKVEVDSVVLGSPALADGRVYVATQSSLFAID
jgi:outer membrane protein assembly factor BamB